MATFHHRRARRLAGRHTAAAIALIALLASCQLDVENPGPVQDQFLDLPTAHQAVVNGAGRAVANSLASGTGGSLGFDASAISRELHPGGQTGSFRISPRISG